jgi:hypothetical protein
MDGVAASAAKISARFVADLEPGIMIAAEIGFAPRKGAGQSSSAPDVFPAVIFAAIPFVLVRKPTRYSCDHVWPIRPIEIAK